MSENTCTPDLALLARLDAEASPPPWSACTCGCGLIGTHAPPGMPVATTRVAEGAEEKRGADARLIAEMRNALPGLLEAARDRQAVLDSIAACRAEKVLEHWQARDLARGIERLLGVEGDEP